MNPLTTSREVRANSYFRIGNVRMPEHCDVDQTLAKIRTAVQEAIARTMRISDVNVRAEIRPKEQLSIELAKTFLASDQRAGFICTITLRPEILRILVEQGVQFSESNISSGASII